MRCEIVGVRTRTVDYPDTHEHVTHIMLANRSIEPRETVLEHLSGGQEYVVAPRTPVVADECPRCYFVHSLRAGTRTNALLSLARF